MNDKLQTLASSNAGLVARPVAKDEMHIVGRYHVECVGADGQVKWADDFDNLVTTVGKNEMLDLYLSGTSWTTGTVYMGLKGTGTAAAGDTMASHSGWSELDASSSSGARQSVTFASASSGSKATSAAVAWSITGSATVAGCFIAVKSAAGTAASSINANTNGTLFSAGDFSGGDRSVISGDTLNVTYSVGI